MPNFNATDWSWEGEREGERERGQGRDREEGAESEGGREREGGSKATVWLGAERAELFRTGLLVAKVSGSRSEQLVIDMMTSTCFIINCMSCI